MVELIQLSGHFAFQIHSEVRLKNANATKVGEKNKQTKSFSKEKNSSTKLTKFNEEPGRACRREIARSKQWVGG